MKLVAVSQRGAKKDFYNLSAILQERPLRRIVERVRTMDPELRRWSGQVGLTGDRFEHLFDDLGVKCAAGMKRKDETLQALGVNPMTAFRAEHDKSGLQQHRLCLRCREPGQFRHCGPRLRWSRFRD